MTTSTSSSARATIEWLAPSFIEYLLGLDVSDPSTQHTAVPVVVLIPIAVLEIMTDDFVLTEHGREVIDELRVEENKFAALNNLLSGEAREWLLNPVAAVNEVVKVELNVSDLRDVETGARTGYGTRFLWYLDRQSV
jgi:hypothetical protein